MIPIRNEINRLPSLLEQVELQTLQPRQVFFVDGRSDDGSREWLYEAARARPRMTVIDNPARIIPAALNRAFDAVDSDVLARMDAHVDYPEGYLSCLVRFLEHHPTAAGAGVPYTVEGSGLWGEAIAAVLRRPWGNGEGAHQVGTNPGPVPHVRWCAYRMEAIRAAGGWDERMHVNEDEEMDIRVRKCAGDLWLVPVLRCTWHTRSSWGGLARQMWRYGYFRAITVRKHPRSLTPRIVGPPSIASLAALALLPFRSPARPLAAAYLAASTTLGAYSAAFDGASAWRGALALPSIHLIYGFGFLAGILRWPRRASQSGT